MNMEFYSPRSTVPGIVIQYARGRIADLYNLVKTISGAEVRFKEIKNPENSKCCEISLAITGGTFSVTRSAGNYMQAARMALDAITKEIIH